MEEAVEYATSYQSDTEPSIVIKASDVLSCYVLGKYAYQARMLGCSENFVTSLMETEGKFLEWRSKNKDKIKFPD